MEHIRDRGRSERQASQVRLVIEGMAGYLVAVEPVPESDVVDKDVTGYTMTSGWDSEGRYIFPNE